MASFTMGAPVVRCVKLCLRVPRWFAGNYCWSSQEYNANNALYMNNNGNVNNNNKTISYSVLPGFELQSS